MTCPGRGEAEKPPLALHTKRADQSGERNLAQGSAPTRAEIQLGSHSCNGIVLATCPKFEAPLPGLEEWVF